MKASLVTTKKACSERGIPKKMTRPAIAIQMNE